MRLSYCGQQIRRYDNDRYLTALLAPADRREALFSLYAFNMEIAKTREAVSEPMVGQIRLQWWRDAIAEVYAGDIRDHQVLRPLAAAIDRHQLSRPFFDTLIDAREFDLADKPPEALADLVDYIEGTSSALIRLALEVLKQPGAAADSAPFNPAHEAAKSIGIAWGLTGHLRAVAFHASAKRQYLPAKLMRDAGADPSDLFELRGSPAMEAVVQILADAAYGHLRTARGLRRDVPRSALPALLPGALAQMYLRRIANRHHNVFGKPIQIAQPSRQLRLLAAVLTGRY